ncbi:hypothetical protein BHECKSOX_588 [Bathymodiolus heckerae thiotrophic gill symbiont]|nr:hypothetical protein BHECKSOX_588 [Bathymodiolus heckerae thiotrophic gill symbiont]
MNKITTQERQRRRNLSDASAASDALEGIPRLTNKVRL